MLLVLLLALLVAENGALVAAGRAPAQAAGGWRWPLDPVPEVVAPFAPGATRYEAGHYGVDLAADVGAPVLAAGEGTVLYAGLVAGRGVVVVGHGVLRTTYEPVQAGVGLGDSVVAGQVVGRLTTGHACAGRGPCLHWGLRRGEEYLDPTGLVSGRVRLLPLLGVGTGAAVPVPPAPRRDAVLGQPGAAASDTEEGSGAAPASTDRPGDLAAPGREQAAPVPPVVEPHLADGAATDAGRLAVGAGAGLGLLAGLVLLAGRTPPQPPAGAPAVGLPEPLEPDDGPDDELAGAVVVGLDDARRRLRAG